MITYPPLLSARLQEATTTATAVALDVATDVSLIILAVAATLLMVVVIVILTQLKRLLVSLQSQVQPVTDRARVAAENVEYISGVVREDVQRVHSSVAGLSERLKDASVRMEERVEEFNALMDTVQSEAESVFLDTAAVVEGVRAGARVVGNRVAQIPLEEHPAEDLEVPDVKDQSSDDTEGTHTTTGMGCGGPLLSVRKGRHVLLHSGKPKGASDSQGPSRARSAILSTSSLVMDIDAHSVVAAAEACITN